MNILFVTNKYPPDAGGLAVSCQRLAHGLIQAGHNVFISVPGAGLAPGAYAESEENLIVVLRIGLPNGERDAALTWFKHLVALHAAYDFDMIHALYVGRPAFVAVSAARYIGLPSLVSARGGDMDVDIFDPGKFPLMHWTLHNTCAITAVSNGLARRVRTFAPGCDVRFIPNSVDSQVFTPGEPDEALVKSLDLADAFVVAFFGEARPEKGLEVLLPAFARLCNRSDRKVVLLLVGAVVQDASGDASHHDALLDILRQQSPAYHIRLVPYVPHTALPAYYRLADVVVVPSLHDGMPNTVLEAMACGRAVIASNVGGIPDALCNFGRDDGMLVHPGNTNILADALLELMNDPDQRGRLGRAARVTTEIHFGLDTEIESTLKLYRDVMRKT